VNKLKDESIKNQFPTPIYLTGLR